MPSQYTSDSRIDEGGQPMGGLFKSTARQLFTEIEKARDV